MDAQNKHFLDLNRYHLDTIKSGFIKNISVQEFRRIIIAEFIPTYGPVYDQGWDQVAKLVQDTYREYDKWLIENPEKATV